MTRTVVRREPRGQKRLLLPERTFLGRAGGFPESGRGGPGRTRVTQPGRLLSPLVGKAGRSAFPQSVFILSTNTS